MQDEFEVISHSVMKYKLFLVNMLYRTPHTHKDFEICLLLDGEITLFSYGDSFTFDKKGFWIMNPFESHELKAQRPALLLSLQVSPSFFKSYFPQIENIEFAPPDSFHKSDKSTYDTLSKMLIEIAYTFFDRKNRYELRCTGLINIFFDCLLEHFPHTLLSEKEKIASKNKAGRMRNITDYIDSHYSEKLLLSEIAEKESLSLNYLSHFFKDSFGMPFQEYLLRIRCEKARQLLLLTNLSLLDICISCGFSDPKYFNKGFQKQYGCSPKEYRRNFEHEELRQQQKSMLTTQEFMSPSTSMIILEKHLTSGDFAF